MTTAWAGTPHPTGHMGPPGVQGAPSLSRVSSLGPPRRGPSQTPRRYWPPRRGWGWACPRGTLAAPQDRAPVSELPASLFCMQGLPPAALSPRGDPWRGSPGLARRPRRSALGGTQMPVPPRSVDARPWCLERGCRVRAGGRRRWKAGSARRKPPQAAAHPREPETPALLGQVLGLCPLLGPTPFFLLNYKNLNSWF